MNYNIKKRKFQVITRDETNDLPQNDTKDLPLIWNFLFGNSRVNIKPKWREMPEGLCILATIKNNSKDIIPYMPQKIPFQKRIILEKKTIEYFLVYNHNIAVSYEPKEKDDDIYCPHEEKSIVELLYYAEVLGIVENQGRNSDNYYPTLYSEMLEQMEKTGGKYEDLFLFENEHGQEHYDLSLILTYVFEESKIEKKSDNNKRFVLKHPL